MVFLKQKLKQLLINRQRKIYDKTLKRQNLNFNEWIEQQEQNLKIDTSILTKNGNSLTNDLETTVNDANIIKNEGNASEYVEPWETFEMLDPNCLCTKKRIGVRVSSDFFCEHMENFLTKIDFDAIVLTIYAGQVSRIAYPLISRQFLSNENTVLIYGDEDIKKENIRENPWFKPDWSPDRFLSGFYFGGLIAFKREAFYKAYLSCMKNEVFDSIPEMKNMERLYLFLFEMLKMQNAFGKRQVNDRSPVCHISEILYHSRENGYNQIKDWRLPDAAVTSINESRQGSVSIVIPSKDNPDVLFCCLDSLLERTKSKCGYEIILVDNGSSQENKRRIEDKVGILNGKTKSGMTDLSDSRMDLLKSQSGFCGISYLYQPMKFNFSRMCNTGAKAAEGELLLFLNDDMEILEPDWMDLMAQKASLSYAGAVGAKLLYPRSRTIQHAGITNLRVGPAHKLQFLSDEEVLYFGMNRGVHNMLAVTGACLMVKKKVFDQAGGFCQDLAVAFNDVDLCYSIYEQGYYNIVRNDVAFYHHESLSRGKDGESEEKQLRLLREKDILYERHQELYGYDPFYHPRLATDMLESEYSPAYRYQVTLDMPWSNVENLSRKAAKANQDQCLVVGMECAMDIYKWKYGVSAEKGKVKEKPEEAGYYFQGYSFVIGSDNACYKKKLLLKNQENGEVYGIWVENRYRQDIKNNLKDQINVDLTGFAAKMRKKEIPAGVYQFGMMAEDQCSRQRLINWSNWVIEI